MSNLKVLRYPIRVRILQYVRDNGPVSHKDICTGLQSGVQLWRHVSALTGAGFLRREKLSWKDVRYRIVEETLVQQAVDLAGLAGYYKVDSKEDTVVLEAAL